MLRLGELAQGSPPVSTSSASGIVFSAVDKAVYRAAPKFEKLAMLPIAAALLESNASGTLVAAAAGTSLYVLSRAGTTEAALTTPAPILQLLWHPCGVNDSCLVVLVQGSVLMYYLSSKGVHTETYKLAASSSSCVNVSSTVQSTVAISFGSAADETGLFTLYLVSDEADIFCLCPFLPPEFCISNDYVRGVLDTATTDDFNFNQSAQAVNDTARAEKKVLTRQLSWASELFKQAGTCELVWNEGSGKSCLVFKRPPRPLLAIQGPLKQVPYPEILYSDVALGLGFFAAGPASIAVLQTNSHVLFYLVDPPARVMWSGAVSDAVTTFSLIEAVKIPAIDGKLRVTSSVVVVQSAAATVAIEMPWLAPLLKSIETGSFGKLPASTVAQLPAATLMVTRGYVSLFDVKTGKLVRDWSPNSAVVADIELQKSPSYQYESLVDGGDNMRRVTALMEAMTVKAPAVPRNSQVTNDLEGYEDLAGLASHYEAEMARLYKAISASYAQVDVQRGELHRQLSKLKDTLELKHKLDKSLRLTRLHAALQRQKTLQQRVAALDGRLGQQMAASLPLSASEKKFFAELERLQASLDGPRGLSARVGKVVAQADALAQPQSSETSTWTPALRAIQSQLNVQSVTLGGLRKELTELKEPTPDTSVYDLSQIS